jgi:hypothetical protein
MTAQRLSESCADGLLVTSHTRVLAGHTIPGQFGQRKLLITWKKKYFTDL